MPIDQKRLRDLFIEACDQPADQQRAFVDDKCADDLELRTELLRLLQSDGSASGILADDHITAKIQPPYDLVGQTIDKYKVLQEIGEGGFGIVYMAQQVTPVKRKVALKVIKPGMDTRDAIARFEAERQALALMEHPNICRVLDAGSTESGHPFFVMELVRGVPITEYCRKQNVPVEQRLRLFQLVCQAVQHAHSKGIIHRDLKPSNVMITLHDTIPVPKIIDFGISKALNQQLTERTLFTRYGQMLGTPMYMSPEQAELSGLDIDIRSDVYSLGVLMYELLTSTPPFSAERLQTAAYADMIRIISEEDPPTPSTRLSSLSKTSELANGESKIDYRQLGLQVRGDLDRIVMKALEKNRNRRYDTVNDLARDIDRYMCDEPVSAGTPSMAYRFRKFVRRNRALVTGVSAVLAALMLGLVVSTIGFINARSANERAESALLDEQTQRSRAEQEESRAKQALESEREQRERLEASVYFQRIARAQRELSSNNLESAARILEECPIHLRGWEWNYLANVSNTSVRTYEGMLLKWIFSDFSPDGKYFAAGCSKWLDRECVGNLIVWDIENGNEVTRVDGLKGGSYAIDFSLDGQRIAAANGNRGETAVWDTTTGAKLFVCATGKSFHSVKYSPTDDLLAAVGTDRIVHVFDANSGKQVNRFEGHNSSIFGLDFSPDGKMIATTSHDGELILWDSDSGDVIARFENSGNRCARFSPDGSLLVTCGYGLPGAFGGIFVYEINDSITKVAEHRTNFGHCTRIEFSPDSQHIALNGHGGAVRVWQPVSGHEVLSFPAHTQQVNHAIFSPDGRQILSAGSDLLVKLWDLSASRTPMFRRPDRSFIHGFAFHPNGDVAVGGGYNLSAPSLGKKTITRMRIGKNSQPNLLKTFGGADQWISAVDYNSDGSLLAAAGSRGRVCIWESNSDDVDDSETQIVAETKFAVQAHSGAVNCIAFNGDGTFLVSGGDDGKLSVVDVEKGAMHQQFESDKSSIRCLDVHPGQNIVVSAGSGSAIRIFDLDLGKELQLLQEHEAPVTQVLFSPDGQLCASGDESGNVVFWTVSRKGDAIDFSLHRSIRCHAEGITGISFSPDQSRLATISSDATVAVWDLNSYQEAIRLTPAGENSNFFSVKFSPDGTQLLAARAGIMSIWNSNSADQNKSSIEPETDDLIRWHQQEMERCEVSKNWFGVVFHADRLIKLDPENSKHHSLRAKTDEMRTRQSISE